MKPHERSKLWEWMQKRFLRRHGYLPTGPIKGYIPDHVLFEEEIER